MNKNIKEGEYAMCWYFKIPNDYREGIDLYYCKVLKLGEEHSTCEIYHGQTFNPHIIRGTFKNVCTADILEFDGSPVPPKTKKNTINFSKEVKKKLAHNINKVYTETDMMVGFCAGFEKGKIWDKIPAKEFPHVFDNWMKEYKKDHE